jgi:hypothetical protein
VKAGTIANRDGVQWRKLRLPGARDMSANPDVPLPMRLHYLACWRAGPAGHAVFGPEGEIFARLRKPGGGDYSRSQLNRALADARKWGVLGEPSTLACLVVPCEIADTDMAEKFKCPVHGHGLGWYRGAWADHRTGYAASPILAEPDYALA